MKDDIESERDELLRIINKQADESMRLMLALTPEPPQPKEELRIITSTEGTWYARVE